MKEEQKHLEHAREKCSQGDFRAAITDLNKAIKVDPKCVDAYAGRAFAKDQLGDRPGALEDLGKAIAIDSSYAYAYVERGSIRLTLEDYGGVIEDCNKAIAIEPDDPLPYLNRARAHYQRQQYRKAQEDLQRAIAAAPEDWEYRQDAENLLRDTPWLELLKMDLSDIKGFMPGSVAQIAALTAYGNYFLSGQPSLEFDLSNSTAQYSNTISFIDRKEYDNWLQQKPQSPAKPRKEHLIADSPAAWFSIQKRAGIESLTLHYVPHENDPGFPERYSAGWVGGGGGWLIEARRGTVSEYWDGCQAVTDRDSPDERIWSHLYVRTTDSGAPSSCRHDNLKNVRALLEANLDNILAFSSTRDHLWFFTECFRMAKKCLSSDNPLELVAYKDIVPPSHYGIEALRLLAACQPAWVFGGMGTWNDLGLEGDKEYEKVSEELYRAICITLAAAINSPASL